MADDFSWYVCTLTPESLEKAKKELNEVPAERLNAAKQLREWILQQPHLTCRTDLQFLLQFLRGAKFSQLRAREMIEGMTTLRTERPDWFSHIDTREEILLNCLKTGYALPLPKKDAEGRIILLNRIGRMDPKLAPKDRFRLSLALGGIFAYDENVQVNGMVMVMDFTGFSAAHVSSMNMGDMKKFSTAMQNFMPGRMKGFHYYNVGAFLDFVMGFVKGVMKQKYRERLHIHNTMESLYKHIPMEMLPLDYLPDDYEGPHQGTTEEILDGLLKRVTTDEYRNQLLKNTTMEWRIDESKRISNDEPAASFRKLNVD